MLIVLAISIALVLACILCHYEVLRAVNDVVPRVTRVPERARILVAIGGAVASHVFQVLMFAFAYYLLRDYLRLGTFAGHFRDAFSSFLYFSTETYTTTGFGDIRPIGYVRLLIGVEALTGMVMVGWTVSFSYLQMRRFW
ncbi:MAG TPA: ion channel [Burkholderiales bacterium]|nr:ion channel [Burkholderiales bacterium]